MSAARCDKKGHMKDTLKIVALFAGAAVTGIPRAVANAFGACYRSHYELGGRSVDRPGHFSSKAHKAAFENVGDYVCNALTRDVMISFRDRDLSQENFLRPKGVSIEVWHQVLECFADAGLIERYWEIRLPSFDGTYALGEWSYQTPAWHPDGTRITETSKDTVIGGTVAGSAPFDPGLLTDAQKASLLGTRYALTYTDCLTYSWHGGDRDKPGEQRYVALGEEHFKPVYVRNRSLLGDKEINEGVDRLAKVFAAAA